MAENERRGRPETMEETVARMIRMADERGDFITGLDGFVVFWPTTPGRGCFEAWHLRALADELDKRNAEWAAQIEEDLCGRQNEI